jgi:hypothetical protein
MRTTKRDVWGKQNSAKKVKPSKKLLLGELNCAWNFLLTISEKDQETNT